VPLSPEEHAALVQQRRARGAAGATDGVEGLGVQDGEDWLLQAGGLDGMMDGVEVGDAQAAATADAAGSGSDS
jgi:hypothetical protein